MNWIPSVDSWIGIGGGVASLVGLVLSAMAAHEASKAKAAAENAETAAKAARDSVRRDDRKAKLLTKLTTLLAETDALRSNNEQPPDKAVEAKFINLRRELARCSISAKDHFPEIHDELSRATISLDGREAGAEDAIMLKRNTLLVEVGDVISDALGKLELGMYDNDE